MLLPYRGSLFSLAPPSTRQSTRERKACKRPKQRFASTVRRGSCQLAIMLSCFQLTVWHTLLAVECLRQAAKAAMQKAVRCAKLWSHSNANLPSDRPTDRPRDPFWRLKMWKSLLYTLSFYLHGQEKKRPEGKATKQKWDENYHSPSATMLDTLANKHHHCTE